MMKNKIGEWFAFFCIMYIIFIFPFSGTLHMVEGIYYNIKFDIVFGIAIIVYWVWFMIFEAPNIIVVNHKEKEQ